MTMEHRVSFRADRVTDTDMCYTHYQPDGGRITVVDRMTGFGWRDIETGYKSPCGKFWLASGRQDIRDHLHDLSSDDEMAEWVMRRANNCVASPHHRGYPYITHDELMRWEARGQPQP